MILVTHFACCHQYKGYWRSCPLGWSYFTVMPGLNLRAGGAHAPEFTPPELQAQKQEIEECHQALSEVLGKPERRLVLQIIDAKDRIAEDTSIDSFIFGFELARRLSVELNHYENERSVSCRTAMGLGARFTSKEEEK